MNNLYKTKKVLLGLNKHPSYSCKTCPYNDVEDCTSHLMEDAFDVIDALNAELKKRTNNSKNLSYFLAFTPSNSLAYDGKHITGDVKLLVKKEDILCIYATDDDSGSVIQLKDSNNSIFKVTETLNDILDMIAKGEEEDECAG